MKLPSQLPITMIKPDKVTVHPDRVEVWKNKRMVHTFVPYFNKMELKEKE